ncbi:hypothetical protein P40081_29620 [Paenibacillus sp. FSL P4-0081]|nr:hypothetical protein P40081_29620 [Paenibacillus sp. FSL P4-0081]
MVTYAAFRDDKHLIDVRVIHIKTIKLNAVTESCGQGSIVVGIGAQHLFKVWLEGLIQHGRSWRIPHVQINPGGGGSLLILLRHQGYGRKLIGAAGQWIRKLGIQRMGFIN